MPRVARVKSPNAIFHIVSRSISELDLYKNDDDKLVYMEILKEYQTLYNFNVCCYCLMTNHCHLIIDANGADISDFMHDINLTYALYYNKKYKRHGHLFQDRYSSSIIGNLKYLMVASAYVHNNPIKISKYSKHPEEFKFSSLAVYLGLKKDPFKVVDYNFVLSLFGEDFKSARSTYYKFLFQCSKKECNEMEFKNVGTLYISHKKIIARSINYKWIIDYVARKTCTEKSLIYTKNNKKATESRALLVLLLKSICNFSSAQICSLIGNITQTNVSRLVHMGLDMIETNPEYQDIFDDFILTP